MPALSEDGKTRRWGEARRAPAFQQQSRVKNRLDAVAGSFFWPFAGCLQPAVKSGPAPSRMRTVSLDPMVLARLLLYLAKILVWTAMGEPKRRMLDALAQLVWASRYHKVAVPLLVCLSAHTHVSAHHDQDAAVVRACMVALCESMLSLDAEALATDWASAVDEAVNWLTAEARDAVDRDTSELARVCLAELARQLKPVMEKHSPGADV